LLEGVYLQVDKLDSSSITRGDNVEHIHAPAVTIPRGAILEDLRDLWSNVLGTRLLNKNIKLCDDEV
jgi:hypothetical protein